MQEQERWCHVDLYPEEFQEWKDLWPDTTQEELTRLYDLGAEDREEGRPFRGLVGIGDIDSPQFIAYRNGYKQLLRPVW